MTMVSVLSWWGLWSDRGLAFGTLFGQGRALTVLKYTQDTNSPLSESRGPLPTSYYVVCKA